MAASKRFAADRYFGMYSTERPRGERENHQDVRSRPTNCLKLRRHVVGGTDRSLNECAGHGTCLRSRCVSRGDPSPQTRRGFSKANTVNWRVNMAEHILSPRHLDKCGHAGCKCLVDPGQSYCSQHCEHADGAADSKPQDQASGCKCGHPDCK
jgi:hypothetical protein